MVCAIVIEYVEDMFNMGSTSTGHDIVFEELRDIVAPIAKKHGVDRVYLFGSRARGDNKSNSDFDFCIDVPTSFDIMDICSFLNDLKDALGNDVDVVCEDNLRKKQNFMEGMLRDRKIVFEA